MKQITPVWKSILSILPIIFYGLYIVICVFFIIHNAQFDVWDCSQFWETTYLGKWLPLRIWPHWGRFWPLGLVDYNLLLLTPFHSPTAHFVINAVSFVCIAPLLFYVIYIYILPTSDRVVSSWIAFFGSLLLLSRIYFVFIYLIFAERIISLLIVLFIFSFYQLQKTDKWGYLILCLLCAVYMTYCKETIFAALLVFSIFILLFEPRKTLNQKIVLIGLILNALIFILIYLICIYPKINHTYDMGMSEDSVVRIFFYNIYQQKQILLLIPVVLIRVWEFVKNKDRKHCFYDALLLAGIVYYLEACVLHLKDMYYITPVFVFTIVPLCYYISWYWNKKMIGRILFIGLIVIACNGGKKQYKDIKLSQRYRVEQPAKFQGLVDLYDQGYQLCYFPSKYKGADGEIPSGYFGIWDYMNSWLENICKSDARMIPMEGEPNCKYVELDFDGYHYMNFWNGAFLDIHIHDDIQGASAE